MSHRLGMSLAAQNNWEVEAFDISTAFLQGLKYGDISAKARSLGLEIRELRQVWLRPPANVWRHLRNMGFTTVLDEERHLFVLHLLKPCTVW